MIIINLTKYQTIIEKKYIHFYTFILKKLFLNLKKRKYVCIFL